MKICVPYLFIFIFLNKKINKKIMKIGRGFPFFRPHPSHLSACLITTCHTPSHAFGLQLGIVI